MGNSKRSAESGKRGRTKVARPATELAAGAAPAEDAVESAPPLSFESALERLEVSVARLEEGEMPLEEALELFESGVKLSRQCQSTLEEAERRIEILVADRGSLAGDERTTTFDVGEDDEDVDDESGFGD